MKIFNIMGKYNFDEMTIRRGTNCVKWDAESPVGPISEDVIPLWVADMDFKVAPEIVNVLKDRVDQEIFGYTHVPDSYYEAAVNWWERRRGWHTEKDWYLYIAGVVPAMSVVVKALTQYEIVDGEVVEKPNRGRGPHGELPKMIIQSPAYNCFFSTAKNNLCELSINKLIYDTEGDQATWYIDFEDLERRAADPMAKVLLFCNPHNPCGRVWPREDLERVADICRRNGVIVISDEIHCELEMPGYHFTPMASISQVAQDNTVTMNSINELCEVNPFGVLALQAAYNEGEPWLKELNEYLYGNYRTLLSFFEENLPEFPVSKLEGTYLVWVDVSALNMSANDIENSLLLNEKVWINSGVMYGLDGFMRINIACPRARLQQGLDRIATGFHRLMT